MPSLFCLIGSYWCDHRDRMILWPVTHASGNDEPEESEIPF